MQLVKEFRALGNIIFEKWISNSRAVLHTIAEDHWVQNINELDPSD